MIPDAIGAIVTLLGQSMEVDDLVDGRIYGGELPRDQLGALIAAQAKAVVVAATPGGFSPLQRTYVPVGTSRIDTRCYGETPEDAMAVHRAVYPVLKQMRARLIGPCILYAITPVFEAASFRDPDASDWPFVLAGYTVVAAERAVPA